MLRSLSRQGFTAMSAVTLVLAHNLVFVAGYGAAYRELLARTGHGQAWSDAVVLVLSLGFGLAVAAGYRIVRLTREVSDLRSAGSGGRVYPLPFLPGLLWLWLRLVASAAALYTLQENLEHVTAGAPAPGLAVLGAVGPPNALLIIAAVAAAVAIVGQLYRWRLSVLEARIAAAHARLPRAVGIVAAPRLDDFVRLPSVIGRRLAVRAPPLA